MGYSDSEDDSDDDSEYDSESDKENMVMAEKYNQGRGKSSGKALHIVPLSICIVI